MSIERRLERLERDYPPYTPRQIQLVDVCGLAPDEAERVIRDAEDRAGSRPPGVPPGEITMIIVGCAEPAPEGDAA